jgi:lysostaphin-type peptidase family protein
MAEPWAMEGTPYDNQTLAEYASRAMAQSRLNWLAGLAVVGCVWWSVTSHAIHPWPRHAGNPLSHVPLFLTPPAAYARREPVPTPAAPWMSVTVETGDNLSLILARLGIPAAQTGKILASSQIEDRLTRLQPGQELRPRQHEGDPIRDLLYPRDRTRTARISGRGETLHADTLKRPIEMRIAHAVSTIEGSFLRTPVDYTRVSSGFSSKRYDPVLHTP